jgi:methionyl-tRNA synthetase
MLMAHGEYLLPSEIPANEFLNLEGRKLSTSENWAVWLPEYLKEFEPDPLRYALAANLPENRDIDFTWYDFWSRNNNELADILGNFVNRVAQFIKNNYKGRIPKTTDYRKEDKEILVAIESVSDGLGELIEKFQIKDALRLVMTLPALGNRYFDYQAPWRSIKDNPKNCEKTINVCSKIISSLEILLQPFIPFTTNKIRAMLGFNSRTWEEAKNPALPDELKKIEVLFPKIEKSRIDAHVAKLGKKPKKVDPALDGLSAETKGGVEETEKKMAITIDDFKKLELKVAKIIAAEKVAGTDKLVKMNIDLGTEKRQIVAGIGMVYPPESLVGKTIIIVANLAPAKIRGVESHGMLLAAVEGSNISVVTLDKELSPGSLVS